MHYPCSSTVYGQQAAKKSSLPAWAIGLMILGALGMCGLIAAVNANSTGKPGSSKPVAVGAPAPKPAAPPAKTVRIGEILSAYKGNELKADAEYKDKTVTITGGIVDDIKKDILDQPFVTLGSTGGPFEIPQVQCFVKDGLEGKAAKLNKGDKITVTGRVDGLMMNVIVNDCSF